MSVFDKSVKEDYNRGTVQELAFARHLRDIISKTDDTKEVYKLLSGMLRVYEGRVLMDMGEGKHPNGDKYLLEDFWVNVGEVRGLRWLTAKVESLIKKANDADEEERKREEKPA